MISLAELNPKNVVLSESHKSNLNILHARINKVRALWAKPMIVTSGVRSVEDHKRIYAELAKRRPSGVIRIPMGSKHLSAAACDIYDEDGSLHDWCVQHESFLAEVGLWCEVKDSEKRVHFQIVAPGSGKRFFKP